MTTDKLRSDLEAIAIHRGTSFTELVEVSGLDPATDFVGADLRGADLRNQDLREYDLTDADITGALIDGAKFDPNRQPKSEAKSEAQSGDGIESAWHCEPVRQNENEPPIEVRDQLENIRRLGRHAESSELEKLVREITGYSRRLGLINRPNFPFSKVVPAPKWLCDFLLERYSVAGKASVKKFVEELRDRNIIPTFTEEEIFKKAVIWHEYDNRRAEIIKEFVEKHGMSDENQSFLRQIAKYDRSHEVREQAVRGVYPYGIGYEEFKGFLKDILEHDDSSEVRAGAIFAISCLKRIDGEVLGLLLEYANSFQLNRERAEALLNLEPELGQDEELDMLIAMLVGKSVIGPVDTGMLTAISIAGRMLSEAPDGEKTLFTLFENATEGLARYWLFSAMTRHFEISDLIRRAISLDFEDPDSTICREAVIEYITGDKFLLNRNIERISSIEAKHRWHSVRKKSYVAIGKSGLSKEEKKKKLLEYYKAEKNIMSRSTIIDILFGRFGDDEDVLRFLEMAKREDPDAVQFTRFGEHS